MERREDGLSSLPSIYLSVALALGRVEWESWGKGNCSDDGDGDGSADEYHFMVLQPTTALTNEGRTSARSAPTFRGTFPRGIPFLCFVRYIKAPHFAGSREYTDTNAQPQTYL